MRSDEAFSTMVADHLAEVSRSLLRRRAGLSAGDVDGRYPGAPAPRRSATLPAGTARVEGGSYILDDATAPARAYLLYARSLAGEAGRPFRYRTAVPTASAPETMVGAVYLAVLGRGVDPDGRRVYVPLIADGTLSGRDLIGVLASSREGLARGMRFVMVPDSSAWLSGATDEPRQLDILAAGNGEG